VDLQTTQKIEQLKEARLECNTVVP